MGANNKWMSYYKLLEEYYKEHGDINLPKDYEVNGFKLGKWLRFQRATYRGTTSSDLSDKQIELLNELEIVWDVREKRWYDCYELLKKYYSEHGDIDLPKDYEVNGVKLEAWLARQRLAYNNPTKFRITDKQIELLNELGIMWSLHDKKWLMHYSLLEEYYREYGNIDVVENYEINGVKLGIWLHGQRDAYHGISDYKLSKYRIELLDKLGMKWNLREEKWDEYYYMLEDYYKEHGNIDIPSSYEINGVRLGKWLVTQRGFYKKKQKGILNCGITDDRIQFLNDLGIKWYFAEEKWDEYYIHLEKYYKEHGNINVPQLYEVDGVKLGRWLYNQRQAYQGRNYKLSKDQIQLLNDLNLDWNMKDTKFLNSSVNDNNKDKYNLILLNRLKHILDDLVYEGLNEISDSESQKEIENIVVKRLWR